MFSLPISILYFFLSGRALPFIASKLFEDFIFRRQHLLSPEAAMPRYFDASPLHATQMYFILAS